MNCASTDSVVVFTAWPPLFATPAPSAFFLSAASPVLFAAGAAADVAGAGLPWRDGSAETVRSLPCVSTIAAGNAVKLCLERGGEAFLRELEERVDRRGAGGGQAPFVLGTTTAAQRGVAEAASRGGTYDEV